VLILPMLLGAFRPLRPDNRICRDMHLMVTGTSFHALYIFHPQVLPSSWFSAPGKNRSGPARCGLGGQKLRAAWVRKHRRGPSTPRYKRCVTRQICEALRQDDDFVGVLTKNTLDKLALMGLRPIVFGAGTLHGTPGQVWRGAPVLFLLSRL
jgi:hypothetical protein